jgi:hypothetical protein
LVSKQFSKKWRSFFKVLHLDFRASQQKLQQFNMADEGNDAPQGADAPDAAGIEPKRS